ncbi:MAG: TPR repeat protein, partial [Nitrospinales bacterium]
LAGLYERGEAVSHSRHECLKWYRRAAEQGNDLAQYNLARMLDRSKDALDWYHKSADQGNTLARVELGYHYQTENEVAAFKWFRLAAEHGHNDAQYQLGLMYRNGRGTEIHFVEAIHWLRRAAEQDHLPAIGALQKLEHALQV